MLIIPKKAKGSKSIRIMIHYVMDTISIGHLNTGSYRNLCPGDYRIIMIGKTNDFFGELICICMGDN